MHLDDFLVYLNWVYPTLIWLGVFYLICGLDDLFIDLVALFDNQGPRKLNTKLLKKMMAAPQKRIAIIVPAWKEGQIIDRMLLGNLERIEYTNYDFFVGVYPNDLETCQAVEKAALLDKRVHRVVNCRPGPTSKGQILNYVVENILQFENERGAHFDAVLMQDAEDVIHPKTLPLVNLYLGKYDFIQVPVFSLKVNPLQLVGGTYIDEFSEHHTKDILVRSHMQAAVPSAGVGTGLSRELILKMREVNEGKLLNENTVTEDYELGVRAHSLGLKSKFACFYYDQAGKREYIATREYFPKKFMRSVRQKTRWTTGIALQGNKNLGWIGKFSNQYFLFRDRKGLLTNIATFIGYPIVLLSFLLNMKGVEFPYQGGVFYYILYANVILMINRFLQRAYCVTRVYGVFAVIAIPLRWPVANLINCLATVRALYQYLVSIFTRTTIAWVKTEHELPEFFGKPVGTS